MGETSRYEGENHMRGLAAAGLVLVQLQAPDGHPIWVNPTEIQELHDARTSHAAHFAPGTKCLLEMGNGKTVQTGTACDEVIQKIWVNHP
jgi:hypothetical protein